MKTIVLKESAVQYVIELDQAVREPVLVEAGGVPVAVLVSPEEYSAFQAWRVEQRQAAQPSIPAEFAAEVEAFERLKPQLLEHYACRAVAVYRGQVVVTGDDKMAVLDTVLRTLGPVPCYIEWVEAETPRRARVPSAWVAQ